MAMTKKTYKIVLLNEEGSAQDHFFHLDMVNVEKLSDKKSVIEVLKVGDIHDRGLTITPEMLEDYVTNFNNGTYGTDIQVNLGHNREGEAAGWITRLFIEGVKLNAEVEWTPLGEEKILKKQYRFTSSELAPSFPDAKTGKKVKNVFIGVALTNVPAVKGMAPVTLSENVLLFNSNNMKKFKDVHAKLMSKKGKITDDEMSECSSLSKDHSDPAEAKKMMAELKKKAADSQEGEEDDEAEKAKPKKVVKNSEENESVNLQEMTKLQEQLAEERKARIELQQKVERKELSERVESELCLSEEKSVGFIADADTTKEVTDFLMSLNEEQRDAYFALSQKLKHSDLSEIGGEGVKVSKKITDEEGEMLSLSEKIFKEGKGSVSIGEAQKMAKSQLEEKASK